MGRINNHTSSLIARRAIAINHQPPNETLKSSNPDLRVYSGQDGPAGPIADLRGPSPGLQNYTLVTAVNSRRVARENVAAAASAIRDADFVVETSNLTRARILIDKVDRPLARFHPPHGSSTTEKTDHQPDSLADPCESDSALG